ncbi:hypothetical protein QTP70_010400, partial [Hemibagrus guttatus]
MAAKSDGPAASAVTSEPEARCFVAVPEERQDRSRRQALLDCCWVLCALLVFFCDGATDVWLSADYYARRDYWWFALTLLFAALPSAVVQVLSFRWFVYDYTVETGEDAAVAARSRSRTLRCCRACMWTFQSMVHILQLGQMW